MITIDNLSYSYPRGSTPALSGVNLQITKGSLFGLLGPNGAGKTTLLSILCDLLPCPAGAVRISDSDITSERHGKQATVALVPQNYAFYPTLSVTENLLFFARVQRISAADADDGIVDVAAITGLEEHLRTRVDRLSGGLKRRLNIAIGLLSKPQLLLLDEPTVGIDPHSRHFILEAIRKINKAGTTIVYTSHYMEEVEYLCDDIAIIDAGKVLVQDSLDSLLHADNKSRLIVDLDEPLSKIQDGALHGVFEFVEKDWTLSIRINHSTEPRRELYIPGDRGLPSFIGQKLLIKKSPAGYSMNPVTEDHHYLLAETTKLKKFPTGPLYFGDRRVPSTIGQNRSRVQRHLRVVIRDQRTNSHWIYACD